MDTKTKLFTLTFALSALVFLFTSCGKSVVINDAESIKSLTTTLNEHLKSDDKVSRIYITCSSASFTGWNIQAVNIDYTNDKNEKRELYLPFEAAGDKRDRPATTTVGGVDVSAIMAQAKQLTGQEQTPSKVASRTIADYDYTQIAKNIQKSIELAQEAGAITMSGLENYSVTFYENPADDEHFWTIMSKASDTKLEGRKIVTEYYQLMFKADGTGKVTMID